MVFTPADDVPGPVVLEEDAFVEALSTLARTKRPDVVPREAAQRLLAMEERGGTYLFDVRTRRLTPLEAGAPEEVFSAEDVELTRQYLLWCERTMRAGDCLRLFGARQVVSGDARFTLALALAQGAVLEEMLEGFRDMADPEAMLSSVMWMGTMYLVLWTVPEPLSKGLAAMMTATLVAYVGVDTFWGLVVGFRRLMEQVDRAHSFDELRVAGEAYGKVMGRSAARAFALLATLAVGNTAAGFAGKVPGLPGSAGASVKAAGELGIRLGAVGELQTVTVSGASVTAVVAPEALSMLARGPEGAGAGRVEGHDHHIASNKFWKDTRSGGPWSPRFQRLFDRAGMSLDDSENIVRVRGHKGPHPEAYHRIVLRRLDAALVDCRTMQQCREVLTVELRRLGQEVATPGSDLNKLVTREP
ncbi:AHH domain-containing protein [Myxococcus sp. CA033]|uniref:AHH domain-containing protein n=1 Tax=Myxococcus sp. CA033 TaxID=2741516 RepID=UPI00157B60D8|nr:AHH domain-containing protein [Myxococcus sp. CA033]